MHLLFFGERPTLVRVYEFAGGSVKLHRDLQPSRNSQEFVEYVDIAQNVGAQSARIYMFSRAGWHSTLCGSAHGRSGVMSDAWPG